MPVAIVTRAQYIHTHRSRGSSLERCSREWKVLLCNDIHHYRNQNLCVCVCVLVRVRVRVCARGCGALVTVATYIKIETGMSIRDKL